MPWYFRKAGIGKLVGTRTWGGLVGIGGYPVLLDSGRVTAPRTPFTASMVIGRSKTAASPPTSRSRNSPKMSRKATTGNWKSVCKRCWMS